MLVTLPGIAICTKDVQPENASSPMLSTLSGIVMFVSDSHSQKAHSPMLVTLSAIVRFLNDVHLEKALSPILVTLSAIVRLLNDVHPSKALSPMLVTQSGITYDVAPCRQNAISLSLPLLYSTPSSYVKYGDLLISSPFKPENGFPLTPFTDIGIVMFAKDLHP